MIDRLASLAHPLFAGIAVNEALDSRRQQALAEVDALSSDALLTGDPVGLRRRLVETYRIDPLRVEWEARTSRASDGGSSVWLFVPFLGAAGLFDMRPTRDEGEHPTGWVREHELVLALSGDRSKARREFERQKALVTDWVGRINANVEPRNERLATTIRKRVMFNAQRARQAAALALDFGPPPLPRRGRPSEERHPSRATIPDRGGVAIEPRRPGRPRSSSDLILERYEDALAATPEPRTRTAIATRFRTLDGSHIGITPRHLRRLLRNVEIPAE
jgi:hypothetical protein